MVVVDEKIRSGDWNGVGVELVHAEQGLDLLNSAPNVG